MEEEKLEVKGSDEIYCPSCAKPVKKDAVICPKCGVQIKELKTSTTAKELSPEEELNEGNRQLSGVRGWLWFLVVIFGLITVTVPFIITSQPDTFPSAANKAGAIAAMIVAYAVLTAIFVIPLIGIMKRMKFSVPYTRVILVITMFSFPIGTIIGATLWKRINHPLAKKYLNYI